MEAVITVLQPLAWVVNPVGAVVAIALFFLFVSGIAGRVLPGIAASAGSSRANDGAKPLAETPSRARISE